MTDLYHAALAERGGASGFYNTNVRVDSREGPVIVRIPIAGANTMDLRVWPEYEVLAALAPYVTHAPRLLHVSESPAFQVHEFIPGDLVHHIAPRGQRVPRAVLHDVVELFAQLIHVPRAKLPNLPSDWPADEDTSAFAGLLSGVTQRVYETFRESHRSLFTALDIPENPLAPILANWRRLSRRPFCLVHADVHRKNMILNGERVVFLDWELALWGDPLYELAVHFHKMAYQDDERATVLGSWLSTMPVGYTRGWENDLDAYAAHEKVKSAIVDTLRYTELITGGNLAPQQEQHLLHKLTSKVNAARKVWRNNETVTLELVSELVRA